MPIIYYTIIQNEASRLSGASAPLPYTPTAPQLRLFLRGIPAHICLQVPTSAPPRAPHAHPHFLTPSRGLIKQGGGGGALVGLRASSPLPRTKPSFASLFLAFSTNRREDDIPTGCPVLGRWSPQGLPLSARFSTPGQLTGPGRVTASARSPAAQSCDPGEREGSLSPESHSELGVGGPQWGGEAGCRNCPSRFPHEGKVNRGSLFLSPLSLSEESKPVFKCLLKS